MSLKNFWIRKLLSWVPFRKHVTPYPKKILVVTTTALGDTLWATPALESLRRSFPHAHIAVLTSRVGLEVLKYNPWIDRLFLFKPSCQFLKDLFASCFDTVLLFHASQRLAVPFGTLTGACRIVGTLGLQKGLDSLLTHALPATPEHEIFRRLRMVEAIGGSIYSESLSFFLQPEEKVVPRPGRWIAMHPGSKDLFKRWPLSHFAQVGLALQKKGYHILITGNPSEQHLVNDLNQQIPNSHVLSLPDLRPFAAALEHLDLLISNDTGPVHLACALNVPVLALYSATDPALCGPHKAPRARVLYRPRTCEPCLKKTCTRPFCLLQLGISEVFNASLELLIDPKMQR